MKKWADSQIEIGPENEKRKRSLRVSRSFSLLARDSHPGTGEHLPVLVALLAQNRGHAQNIVRGGASGELGRRSVDPQEDIAINVGAGQMLYEAAADTGRLQIGEDQDVGSSGHFSDIFSEFSLGNIHHDGGISLQLSVKVGLDSLGARSLRGKLRSRIFAGTVGRRILAAGRHGEQRNARGHIQKLNGQARGHQGNIGKLLNGRILMDIAIGQEQNAVGSDFLVIRIAQRDDLATADGVGARR